MTAIPYSLPSEAVIEVHEGITTSEKIMVMIEQVTVRFEYHAHNSLHIEKVRGDEKFNFDTLLEYSLTLPACVAASSMAVNFEKWAFKIIVAVSTTFSKNFVALIVLQISSE